MPNKKEDLLKTGLLQIWVKSLGLMTSKDNNNVNSCNTSIKIIGKKAHFFK
jgi:hypothetical protein